MFSTLTRVLYATMLLVCTLVMLAAPARAAEPKTFGVLPFTVNGPEKFRYLGDGIQAMLISRLYWRDHVQSVDKGVVAGMSAPSPEAAPAALAERGLDYLVSGSLSVMGEECSLDVTVVDSQGKQWPKTVSAKVDQLIPVVENLASDIGAEVFQRPAAKPLPTASAAPQKQVINAMNPALVHNQRNTASEVYLNPQFRYAGSSGTEGRINSQRLNFDAHGMAVGDADGDGVSEVFFITDRTVYAYTFRGNLLEQKAEHTIRNSLLNLRLSLDDMDRDGLMEIIVSAADDGEKYAPHSYILHYRNGTFEVVEENIRMHLAMVRTPPDYTPMLVGQEATHIGVLLGPVHEVVRMNGELRQGKRLYLPERCNPFNIAFLPEGDGYKVITTDGKERLRVYNETGKDALYKSDATYSGSPKGLYYYDKPGGLEAVDGDVESAYYLPLNMLPVDLDRDGHWELLVNRPISMAAQFFERYRFFPQGEIHALFWDGVGLNLMWKTRRIKGAVVDFKVADINDDGVMDLCVCINTHPGVMGTGARKTMLLAYPLDVQEQGAPEVDSSFKEDTVQ